MESGFVEWLKIFGTLAAALIACFVFIFWILQLEYRRRRRK